MLVACWSSKGGSGTTVVATSLSLLLSRRDPLGALLVDVAGDAPAALGLPEPDSPGLAGWLAAGADVPPDALARLEVPTAASALALLPRGAGPLDAARADVLVTLLAADPRPVVIDCGADLDGPALALAAGATRSILVTRACFLSLRRALTAPIRPSEIVLLTEPGRSLTRLDVEDCLGAPVVAEVAVDPSVARAVDAGLLASRLPRGLARELSRAA
jgi:MinD-like ATPase involved in chromosome partitioning or flagellar assembly